MQIKDIDDVFDADGVFARRFGNYEYREGQHEMARLVAKSYNENSITAIEAGTGIGKSFAYLVVALLSAQENSDDRTVIATSTINLQRQLFEKDIPLLFNTLQKKCGVALLLGRNNYLCKRRFFAFLQSPSLFGTNKNMDQLRSFATKTEDGILFKYSGSLDFETKSNICSDSEFCINSACPFFRECFYFKARANAEKAQIIISNHHLLFSDSIYRFENELDYSKTAILPSFNRLIIDEAHNMEGNATDLFSGRYDYFDLRRKIARLTARKGKNLAGPLDKLSSYLEDARYTDLVKEKQKIFLQRCETLNIWVTTFLVKNKKQNEIIKNKKNPRYAELFIALLDAEKSAIDFDKALNLFKKNLILPEENKNISFLEDFTRAGIVLNNIINLFENFLNDETDWKEAVHFIDMINTRNGANVHICSTPLSINNLMKEALFEKVPTIICTSATLTYNNSFDFWFSRIGLPLENSSRPFYHESFSSPFDYKKNLLLLLPQDGTEYSKAKEDEYRKYVNSSIIQSSLSSGGGALILFTSKQMMNSSYEECRVELEKNDIKTLVQGMGNQTRSQILSVFKTDKNSVLFATNSFWEGVDVPGSSLRLLIIVKLPFSSNDNPVFSARFDKIQELTGNGFINYSVPETTLRLKQGFGRLIRTASDRGIVLILDKRIVIKNYGQVMIRSLPESYIVPSAVSSLGSKIESFLY